MYKTNLSDVDHCMNTHMEMKNHSTTLSIKYEIKLITLEKYLQCNCHFAFCQILQCKLSKSSPKIWQQ